MENVITSAQLEVDDDDSCGFRGLNALRQQAKLARIEGLKEYLVKRGVAYKETPIANVVTTTLPSGKKIYFSLVLVPYNRVKYREADTNNWQEMGKNFFAAMCKGESKPYKKFGKKFTFGKHKGKTIEEVYSIDRQYLLWCMNNDVGDSLKERIKEVCSKCEDE